jgi:hypothetical protein
MSGKDLLLDFINYLFILALTAFCIIFFIAGDRFFVFTKIFKALLPLAAFGVIFLIKLKFGRKELAERKDDGNTDLVLYLSYFDKFKMDLIVFGLPLIIILIALINTRSVDITDFFQALIVFAIACFWQWKLFSKKN